MVPRLSKGWVVVALMLACSAAYAGLFTPTVDDQSLKHLYNLFGAVGNQLGPEVAGKQLLGSLIRWLNLGLLAFVCLIVTYTVIMGVIKTAQEGALMGRDGKSGMAAIRTVLGIALLVPGATGYSLIQVFIMWVVIQGVGLADNIWVTGARYLGTHADVAFNTKGGISEDSVTVEGESNLMLKMISPPDSMVPIAMSTAVSHMCGRYISDLMSMNADSAKQCANISTMQKSLSKANPKDAVLKMCHSVGVIAMNAMSSSDYDAYQTALDEEETTPPAPGMPSEKDRLIQKFITSTAFNTLSQKLLSGTAMPKVDLYMATRGSSSDATFSEWQEGATGTLYAVYGIKEDVVSTRDDPAKIKAVCGAYTLGPVNTPTVDAARYLGFQSMHNAMVIPADSLYEDSFYKGNKQLKLKQKDIFNQWDIDNKAGRNTWMNAVKFGITGWRANIEPVIESGEAALASAAGSGIDISEGWIYAGGYYYKFSRSSSDGMGKLQKLANNVALCHFVNMDYSTGDLTSTTTSAALRYPFGCLDMSADTVACRRDWNQVGDNNFDHCAVTPSTDDDEEEEAKDLEENEETSLWQLSLDLLSQETEDHNLAEILPDGASQAVRRAIKVKIKDEKKDFIHEVISKIPSRLYKMETHIKTKLKSEEAKEGKALQEKYNANKELALKDIRKMNEANNKGNSRRDANRRKAQFSFFLNLSLTAAVTTAVAAVAGGPTGAGVVLLGVTWSVIIASAAAWTGLMTAGDPIHKMIIMGQVMGAMGLVAWLIIGIYLSVTTTVAGTMNSMHGITEGTKVALNWLGPLFQMILMVALANAGMLAIYVPMIPLMIYLFAVLGWMITVLEAIVAGPLIAMGVTHPQGQDMLGKSEQALMMLISVFLRPALITIGFFASVLFVRIAFDIFLGTISDYMVLAMGIHGINLIIAVAFLTVYTIVVIGVVEVAFSLINVIPERVMHWIGVQGMAQDLSRQTMQMAQSSSREVGSNVGRAGMAGLSGTSGWQGRPDNKSSTAEEKKE